MNTLNQHHKISGGRGTSSGEAIAGTLLISAIMLGVLFSKDSNVNEALSFCENIYQELISNVYQIWGVFLSALLNLITISFLLKRFVGLKAQGATIRRVIGSRDKVELKTVYFFYTSILFLLCLLVDLSIDKTFLGVENWNITPLYEDRLISLIKVSFYLSGVIFLFIYKRGIKNLTKKRRKSKELPPEPIVKDGIILGTIGEEGEV